MRFANPLDDLMGSRAKVRILRFLARSAGEHSGREIARHIGMGETPTSRALRSLANTLVVVYRSDGRAHWYRLNQDYALVRDLLLPLFDAEARQLVQAVEFLMHGMEDQIECALVYGSAARHSESWDSDLDLLALVRTGEGVAEVRKILADRDLAFLQRYGVASPQILSVRDASQRFANGEAWIHEAVQSGQLLLGRLPAGMRRGTAA